MAPVLSPVAQSAVEHTPVCLDCVGAKGLCKRCGTRILPQLKKPSWVWFIYFKYLNERAAATKRQLRLDKREHARDEARRRGVRISTLLRGGFSPARKAA